MERFNRAERRAQTARLKAKRKGYWGYCLPYMADEVMTPKQLGSVVQHPQNCSCPMGCGNSRKFYGRTLSEVVQLVQLQEQLREILGTEYRVYQPKCFRS